MEIADRANRDQFSRSLGADIDDAYNEATGQ